MMTERTKKWAGTNEEELRKNDKCVEDCVTVVNACR